MTEEELIRGCLKYEHAAQRELYLQWFSKTMHICIRYSKNTQEAKAILLDAFKNVFNGFKNYAELNAKRKKDAPLTLNEWMKNEIISSIVQHMHNNKKEYFVSSTVSMREAGKISTHELTDEQIIAATDKQLVIKALRLLTPSYRAIYNLHEVDGYSHLEISKLLDISEYISKDSLLKAKYNLRKHISGIIPA